MPHGSGTAIKDRRLRRSNLALSSAPVLPIPDRNQPFTDISGTSTTAWGALLVQEDRVVAYTRISSCALSFPISPANKGLAVSHALKEWRCYLADAPEATLVTDPCPNTYIKIWVGYPGLYECRRPNHAPVLKNQEQRATWLTSLRGIKGLAAQVVNRAPYARTDHLSDSKSTGTPVHTRGGAVPPPGGPPAAPTRATPSPGSSKL